MTHGGIEAPGVPALQHDLGRVADRLEDHQDVDAQAAETVADAIADRAPYVTGFLARSVEPHGPAVDVGAIYGPVIDNGWPARNIEPQPFVDEGLTDSQDAVLELYQQHTADALDVIERTY